MDAGQIESLRTFNRLVTERLGVLSDEYLSRSRPLGASRVLWEIGNGAADVRTVRSRLGLDSGYLSRLLRSLEADGLVIVTPGTEDTRIRELALTEAGRRERQLLDEASDGLAARLLAPLNHEQRAGLVEAASTMERLLTAGLVEISIERPTTAVARFCIGQYFAELDRRFATGFDPTISNSAEVEELTEPAGLLLIARLRDEPIGCGALKFHGEEPAEIKRMWVAGAARGLGLGRRLLGELERHAAARNVRTVRLETNRTLVEAISLYRSAGYQEVAAFNDEPFAHHWFEKSVEHSVDTSWSSSDPD